MTVSGEPAPRFSCEALVVAVRVGEGGPDGNGRRPMEAFETVSLRRLREDEDIRGNVRDCQDIVQSRSKCVQVKRLGRTGKAPEEEGKVGSKLVLREERAAAAGGWNPPPTPYSASACSSSALRRL